jgi:SNF2 family DNA or RNA helicase
LDEGHKIRNSSTKVFKEISRINSNIKWVLSGTPIQNTPKDLMTLANWIDGADEKRAVDDIVKTLVLRRTQEEQAILAPRLALPGLETTVIHLDFETHEEAAFYEAVETYYATHAHDTMEANIRCRQASTHPQIFLDAFATKKRKRQDFNIEAPPSASKFKYLVDDIAKVHGTTKEKCLIFATWTKEMKLLQQELKERKIAALIYDGNLTRDNKEAVLYNFKNTSIPVLILQIECGNAGLNLQEASRVYITTPHWNPCVELQAIGRAYRKGQMSKVKCIRLVMRGTIEERCGEIQLDKLEMITDTMDDESMMMRLNRGS